MARIGADTFCLAIESEWGCQSAFDSHCQPADAADTSCTVISHQPPDTHGQLWLAADAADCQTGRAVSHAFADAGQLCATQLANVDDTPQLAEAMAAYASFSATIVIDCMMLPAGQ